MIPIMPVGVFRKFLAQKHAIGGWARGHRDSYWIKGDQD